MSVQATPLDAGSAYRAAAPATRAPIVTRSRALVCALLLGAITWAPRLSGPIDLRWDGGVYYVLGTSLAEGRGYRLLNEPGGIEADQYPPLLPAIIAAHEKLLGTTDIVRVGSALRFTAAAMFLLFVFLAFRFFDAWLPPGRALLATALSILTFHVYFLSDLAFPEVPFTICILLFLGRRDRPGRPVGTFIAATCAYALRTVGVAALAAWVGESILQRRFKQAVARALLAAIPVLAWQAYVGSVESSAAYRQPVYAYQHAAYMFYNVSYTRNISLRDPFAPEKGPLTPALLIRRTLHNVAQLPGSIGETASAPHQYSAQGIGGVFGNARAASAASMLLAALLFVLGCAICVQIGALGWQGEWRLVLFCAAYLGAICLTPFEDQFLRYLAPLVPVFCLAIVRGARRSHIVLAGAIALLCVKVAAAADVFAADHQRVRYTAPGGTEAGGRLFFYETADEDFDRTIDYLDAHAAPADVVSSGTPHWIYLRTGRKAVMPPYEADPREEQRLLDTVPVEWLVAGRDVTGSERYTDPVVRSSSGWWEKTFTSPHGYWSVYRRTPR